MAYTPQGKPLDMIFPHRLTYSERNSRPDSQDLLRARGVQREFLTLLTLIHPTVYATPFFSPLSFCYALYDWIILQDLLFTFTFMRLTDAFIQSNLDYNSACIPWKFNPCPWCWSHSLLLWDRMKVSKKINFRMIYWNGNC